MWRQCTTNLASKVFCNSRTPQSPHISCKIICTSPTTKRFPNEAIPVSIASAKILYRLPTTSERQHTITQQTHRATEGSPRPDRTLWHTLATINTSHPTPCKSVPHRPTPDQRPSDTTRRSDFVFIFSTVRFRPKIKTFNFQFTKRPAALFIYRRTNEHTVLCAPTYAFIQKYVNAKVVTPT